MAKASARVNGANNASDDDEDESLPAAYAARPPLGAHTASGFAGGRGSECRAA